MNLFEHTLSLTDRFSRKITFFDGLLQKVMQKVLPHATVQACGGYACYTTCESPPTSDYCFFLGLPAVYLYYSSSFKACEYEIANCRALTNNCCH